MPTSKTLAELTEIMEKLVRDKGWYSADSKRPQTPRNLAISLSLEAAEVLEHFQFSETPQKTEALSAELADVLLYLLQLASVCEIDLQAAMLEKVALNYRRTWHDE